MNIIKLTAVKLLNEHFENHEVNLEDCKFCRDIREVTNKINDLASWIIKDNSINNKKED